MHEKRLSVSLVIPAYNEERYLKACLDAVAAQHLKPDEVIVVDNNSTDKTAKVARSYPFVRVIQEPRQGVVYARNTGFNAAKGDIIARIDADTVLPSYWTQHVVQFYKQPGHAKRAWTGGPHFYNVRFPRFISGVYSLLTFRSNLFFAGTYTLWGSNMALLNSQWQRVAKMVCTRTGLHEDLDLAIHLRAAGFRVTYDPKVTVAAQLRRVHSNRHELWEYLQWWPRTLRVHRKKSWVVCWFFGAFLLYYLAPILNIAERIARTLGKKPLPD